MHGILWLLFLCHSPTLYPSTNNQNFIRKQLKGQRIKNVLYHILYYITSNHIINYRIIKNLTNKSRIHASLQSFLCPAKTLLLADMVKGVVEEWIDRTASDRVKKQLCNKINRHGDSISHKITETAQIKRKKCFQTRLQQ